MIDKKRVEALIEEKLQETDCFLVSLKISKNNDIAVEIDSETSIDLDFCSLLSRFLEKNLDREVEDYSLEVGSYSISQPFVDVRQYTKNLGRGVEVLTLDSRKIRGVLTKVSDESFTLEVEEKEKQEGEKRKKMVKKELEFRFQEIKYTKLDFSSF